MQERLQKCYEKSPPALGESHEADPGLLLRTLQASFSFKSYKVLMVLTVQVCGLCIICMGEWVLPDLSHTYS